MRRKLTVHCLHSLQFNHRPAGHFPAASRTLAAIQQPQRLHFAPRRSTQPLQPLTRAAATAGGARIWIRLRQRIKLRRRLNQTDHGNQTHRSLYRDLHLAPAVAGIKVHHYRPPGHWRIGSGQVDPDARR